jgi:predicted ATPase/DNA-binding winged helix-turn-helix (wHTH) protein
MADLRNNVSQNVRQGPSSDRAISFGAFRLVPSRQLLLEGDRPLRIGTRAFHILTTLVENAGEIVSKEDLIARVWPNTYVEDGNLRVHIAAIRKILGDGREGNRYVANIPLRGYRFVAPISISRASEAAAAVEATHNLPLPVTRVVGRGDTIKAIVAQLPRERFITLVGAGGVGKTTVALAVAEELIASYQEGVRFIDLTPLSDPNLVPSALASVLGVSIPSDKSIPALISFLRDKKILLIFDNCEHVVEAAAAITSELLKGVESLHVLATSREPLRAEGEHVRRLSPLEFPRASATLTAAKALTFPAVQLFVERAVASSDQFELSDENASVVAEICRRLDGIALAVELAAGRVDAFGVRDLAARLDDCFRLLTTGRRTALPRHQTLRATMNWSYELLTQTERLVLRRLGVFPSGFTLSAARAVVASAELAAADVYDLVANLVAKSLVTADVSGPMARYRLLDTTRTFALEKLAESGELAAAARLHALHYREFLDRGATLWATTPASEWLAAYSPEIDNIRAALDWAFATGGDASTGTALVAASAPLWIQLSLLEECRGRAGQALACLDAEAGRGTRQEMLLQAALAVSFLHTHGPVRQTAATWMKVLKLSEELKDAEYQLRALYGLWVSSVDKGGYPAALASAHQFRTVAEAKADVASTLVGDRLIGVSLHFLGDQAEARSNIERMLNRYEPALHGSPAVRFGLDQRVGAFTHLARILWLQGFPEQAVRTVQAGVAEARARGHTNSLCLVLADGAIPIAILTGDLPMAEQLVAEVIEKAERHALGLWHGYGLGLRGWMVAQGGDAEVAVPLLRTAVDNIWEGAVGVRYAMFLGWLAEALGGAGRAEEGISIVDEALRRSERNEERWCFPELLRIQGELMLLKKEPNVASAEQNFLQSLSWARLQGTLSWELRGAMSLARLRPNQGRTEEAFVLLAQVYDRFTEGFTTADLERARELIDAGLQAPNSLMTEKPSNRQARNTGTAAEALPLGAKPSRASRTLTARMPVRGSPKPH